MGEVVATGAAAGKFAVLNLSTDPKVDLHALGGARRRRRADAGDARHRSVPGAAPAVRAIGARSARSAWCSAAFIVFAQFTLFLVIGVMLFAYYQHVPAPHARPRRRDPAAFVVNTLSGGAAGLHRRRHRRRGAVAVAQLDGRRRPSTTSTAVRPAGCRRSRPDARGPPRRRSAGASCRSASRSRAMDGSVGAGCGPGGAVARERAGAGRVSDRRADDARPDGRDAHRHDRRRRGAGRALADRRRGMDVVHVHGRGGDGDCGAGCFARSAAQLTTSARTTTRYQHTRSSRDTEITERILGIPKASRCSPWFPVLRVC